MSKYFFSIIMLCSLLVGCGTTSAYKCEPNSPQATLGVRNFNIFTNQIIIDQVFKDPYEGNYADVLCPPCTYSPCKITANKITTFRATFIPFMPFIPFGSFPRLIFTTFIPKAGHAYLISVSHSNIKSSDDKISMIIYDVTEVSKDGKQATVYKIVPSIRRQSSYLTNNGGFVDSDYVRKNVNTLLGS